MVNEWLVLLDEVEDAKSLESFWNAHGLEVMKALIAGSQLASYWLYFVYASDEPEQVHVRLSSSNWAEDRWSWLVLWPEVAESYVVARNSRAKLEARDAVSDFVEAITTVLGLIDESTNNWASG